MPSSSSATGNSLCVVRDCYRNACPESDYCEVHKCAYTDCTARAEDDSKYCEEHAKKNHQSTERRPVKHVQEVQRVQEQSYGSQMFAALIKCAYSECYRPACPNSRFCEYHQTQPFCSIY